MSEFGNNILIFSVSFIVASTLVSVYAVSSIFPKKNQVFQLIFRFNWLVLALIHTTVMLITCNGVSSFTNIALISMCAYSGVITFLKFQDYSYTKIVFYNSVCFIHSIIISILYIYLCTEYPNPMISKIITLLSCASGFLPALCLSNLIYGVTLYKNRYNFIFKEIKNNEPEIIDGKEAIPLESLIKIEDECSICLDELKTNTQVELVCSHKFHRVCILTHFNNHLNCPICRKDFNVVIEV